MQIKTLTKLENGLYEALISNGDSLIVHEESVVKFELLPGKTLSGEDLEDLNFYIFVDKAYVRALSLISYKIRSTHEVMDKLSDDYDAKVIDVAIERLKEQNYLNDQHYAEASKNTLLKTTDKGPMELSKILKKHRIDNEIIKEVVDSFDQEIDEIRMNRIKDKLLKRHKGSYQMFINKVKEHCLKRGYQSHHIKMIDFNVEESLNETDNLERDYVKFYNKYHKKFSGYELKTKIYQSLMRRGYSYDAVTEKLGGLTDEF